MPAASHGRSGRPWRRIRQQVLQGSDVCWLCGAHGADTVDHILPISQYPELAHDLSNLRPAHRSCNSSKGAGTVMRARAVTRSRDW